LTCGFFVLKGSSKAGGVSRSHPSGEGQGGPTGRTDPEIGPERGFEKAQFLKSRLLEKSNLKRSAKGKKKARVVAERTPCGNRQRGGPIIIGDRRQGVGGTVCEYPIVDVKRGENDIRKKTPQVIQPSIGGGQVVHYRGKPFTKAFPPPWEPYEKEDRKTISKVAIPWPKKENGRSGVWPLLDPTEKKCPAAKKIASPFAQKKSGRCKKGPGIWARKESVFVQEGGQPAA